MLSRIAGIAPSVADFELQRRILNYLASRSYLSFRLIDVQVRDGIVTLTGQLTSFYEKQVAQESCRRVAGVRSIVNEIEVVAVRSVVSHSPADVSPVTAAQTESGYRLPAPTGTPQPALACQ